MIFTALDIRNTDITSKANLRKLFSKKQAVKIFQTYLLAIKVFTGTNPNFISQSRRKKLKDEIRTNRMTLPAITGFSDKKVEISNDMVSKCYENLAKNDKFRAQTAASLNQREELRRDDDNFNEGNSNALSITQFLLFMPLNSFFSSISYSMVSLK